MQIIRLMPIWSISKFENSLFFLYFLNKDISFNIPWKLMKFKIHGLEGHSEGTMSQNFDLGLSFYFMQSRKTKFQKMTKSYPFLT